MFVMRFGQCFFNVQVMLAANVSASPAEVAALFVQLDTNRVSIAHHMNDYSMVYV